MIPALGLSEPVSSLSHYLGAVILSLLAFRLFARVDGSRRTRAAAFYLLGVCGMFLASGTYHLLEYGHPARSLCWHLDHAMIWVCVSGTIAAVYVLADLQPAHGARTVWAIGLCGLVAEQVALQVLPPYVSPLLYIAMGWVGWFPLRRLVRRHGLAFAAPLLWAAIASTLGGLVDALEAPVLVPRVVEGHEVMHLLILSGMLLFYWAVERCAGLESAPAGAPAEDAAVEPEFAGA